MKFSVKRIVLLRLFDFIKFSFIPSIVCTLLNKTGVFDTYLKTGYGLIFGTILFIIMNMVSAKNCYNALDKNSGLYMMGNATAYLIFVIISVFSLEFISKRYTMWLFSVLIVTDYHMPIELPLWVNVLMFHLVNGTIILSVPAYMKHSVRFLRIYHSKR